jgi:hypothetical protein
MQKIQLYIEGQRVDLFDDESVVLTQTIQNVKDVQKVFTDYSKTFTLPATKENNKIFKHYYNNSITNGFDGRSRVSATLELNHLKFRKGKIKLEGVDLKNNVPHSYKVRFTGNTVTLKDLLGEDKLNALNSLDSINLVYDSSSIKSSFQDNPSTNDVIVPLITHTQRLTYNSHSSANDVGNLHYDSSGGGSNVHGVSWNDLKYALRLDRIIQAIEVKYGITFSNDFFTSTNEPYYNLFMWLHRKKGDVTSTGTGNILAQSLVNTWTVTHNPTQTGIINVSTLNITSTTLNPSSNSFFQFGGLTLKLKTTSADSYNVSIQINGQEAHRVIDASGDVDISDTEYNLVAGGYNVIIESANNITFSEVTWVLETRIGTSSFITSFTSASFTHNNSFSFIISQQIPDLKIIDFLTGVFKMFNLTSYVDDNTGEVIVKTLDNYYSGGVSYDITEFIDRSKSTVNVALPFKEITFEHGDTKTLLAKQHEQLAAQTWGKMHYNQVGGIDFGGDIYKVKTPFSQLKYERLRDYNTDAVTSIQYGYFVDDNQEPYYGKPLLFYPIRNNGNNISFVEDSTTHSPIVNYNIPSNSVALSSATSKYNINFNQEFNEYGALSDPADYEFTDTLFEAYHKDYISDVFDVTNRLTKLTAYLPLRILLNYTLADRFNISGTTYKINSIKTNMLTGKSDLELLNDIYTPPAPAIPPDTTPPTAPVVGTPIVGTNTVNFCWGASSDGTGVGVKSYSVTQDGVLVQRVSATPYRDTYCVTITGLTSGTTYAFGVTATDFNNNVSTTTTINVTTL